jgi:type I restriction enzyme S subunit
LRFDTSKVCSSWPIVSIKEIANKVTDGEHATPQRSESGILLLSARNIQNGYLDLREVDYIPLNEYERIIKRCHPEPGDVLVSCSGAVGRVCLVPQNLQFNLVRSVALIKPNHKVNSRFLQYSLQSELLQNQILRAQNQSAQPNLFLGSINKLKLPLPPIAEQKRIAEILEVWDGAIAIVEQLITAKQKLNKALLMTCFDEEKGDYKKIGSIAKVQSGSTPLRADFDRYFKGGTIAWVKTMDLNNGFICKTDERITQIAIEETSCSVFPQNTILVAMYGGFNQIGRTGLLTIEAAVNQAISAIQLDQDTALPEYVLHYLNYRVEYWKRFAASSRKDPNITRKDVCDFPILVMPLEHQKRVVSLFRNLDLQIQFLIQQHRLYLKQKQGLMQKLLTGDWRVPVEAEVAA